MLPSSFPEISSRSEIWMDGKFALYLVVLTALSGLQTSAELLTPYSYEHSRAEPGRSHRATALKDLGYNDTYEEIEAANSEVEYRNNYLVHRFIDDIWREDGSQADLYGHLAVVGRPWSMLSVTNPYGSGCNEKYWSSRSTVLNTASHRKCEIAMNAGYFRGSGTCLGAVVSDRKVSQLGDNKQNPVFAITDSGKIRIGYITSDGIRDGGYRQAVSGVVWLVRNSSSFVNESMALESDAHEETGSMEEFVSVISARTAIGHDSEGRVMFMHIEGQTRKRGVNLWEFADVLVKHGFVNAINLDGGGSATLVIKDVVAGYPSDHCGNPVFRCGRPVSTIVCVHDVECYPSDCSGHGTCDSGVCHCDSPYVGDGCELLDCSLAHCSGKGNCSEGICECDAGWTGTHCNMTCPAKTYGPDCAQKCEWCSWSSHTLYCDRFNGTWLCQSGYQGPCCRLECDEGWFGAGCMQKCNCSSNAHCSHLSGTCTCAEGWSGSDCSSNSSVTVAPTTEALPTAANSSTAENSSTVPLFSSAPAEEPTDSNDTRITTINFEPSRVFLPLWVMVLGSLLFVLLLIDVVFRRLFRRRCSLPSLQRWRRQQAEEDEHLMTSYPDI